MLRLNNIRSTKGTTHKIKRVGRGPGTGLGKTAGRGVKGQGSRSGVSGMHRFEGGQTPLYRRLPKRGFKNINDVTYAILNVNQLDKLDPAQLGEVTLENLRKARIVKSSKFKKLAILGQGEISKAFQIKADRVSASAQEKIKKAGGSFEILK